MNIQDLEQRYKYGLISRSEYIKALEFNLKGTDNYQQQLKLITLLKEVQ